MSTTIEAKLSEVRFEHAQNFAHVLKQLQVTLLVSTYQAGKLFVIGSHAGKLTFAFHGFDQVMGVAVSKDRLAIGTRRQIYLLNSSHQIASQIEPAGSHDHCWLTRSSFVTGSIHGHDLAWGEEGLWIVRRGSRRRTLVKRPFVSLMMSSPCTSVVGNTQVKDRK